MISAISANLHCNPQGDPKGSSESHFAANSKGNPEAQPAPRASQTHARKRSKRLASANQTHKHPRVVAIASALLACAALVATATCVSGCGEKPSKVTEFSVADLQVLHDGVTLADKPVTQAIRVGENDTVQTKPEGRTRLRLDNGASVIVDGASELVVSSDKVELRNGRIFVIGAPSGHTQIKVGKATVLVSDGQSGIRTTGADSATVYAASGELVVQLPDKGRKDAKNAKGATDTTVSTGETATISDTKLTVAPERVFDDWTGGLVAPWNADKSARQIVGMLWGKGNWGVGEAGSPLTLRSQQVRVKVLGESAATTINLVFFHGGSTPVFGDFRMALPEDALVSGFATGPSANEMRQGKIAVGDQTPAHLQPSPSLEWAGTGWVRGATGYIEPGNEVHVMLSYSQWLPRSTHMSGMKESRDGDGPVVQYRLPLAAGDSAIRIGEFFVEVDTNLSPPTWIRTSHNATVTDGFVRVRKSDFLPSADFVVELGQPKEKAPARMYTETGSANDPFGDYVLVRAEAPTEEILKKASKNTAKGVQLAIVIDTSASMDAGTMDTAIAVVESVIRSLGPQDKAVILAADQTVRPVGPDALGAVDDARKKAQLEALSTLKPGGATDIGLALETAAIRLGDNNLTGMIVYVGDGWASIGDTNSDQMRARLGRRSGGLPRISAVALGSRANQLSLAALVRGIGQLYQAENRNEGAKLAHDLLALALAPTVAQLQLDLGPDVEQVYPLNPSVAAAGSTIYAVGRLRKANPPKSVTLRWRTEQGPQQQQLEITPQRVAESTDVRRRWAEARVQQLSIDKRPKEAIIDVALREGLLTPWTGFTLLSDRYLSIPIAQRLLDSSVSDNAVMAAQFASPDQVGAAMMDFEASLQPSGMSGDRGLEQAIRHACKRIVDKAISGMRACRDSRAAMRADLAGVFHIRWNVDGNGDPSDIKVQTGASPSDEGLNACIAAVIGGLHFPRTQMLTKVQVEHTVTLPPVGSATRTKCSSASRLSLDTRRGLWQQRLTNEAPDRVYLQAKNTCELNNWEAKRALLELILLRRFSGADLVSLALTLEVTGETQAATFLREQALLRARWPEQLRDIRRALLANEGYPVDVYEKQYKAATSNKQRIEVVRRFLQLAPHDVRLNKELLALLAVTGQTEEVQQTAERVRADALSDAVLFAQAAEALKTVGDERGARRMFSEIAEKAPLDPWARTFAGDRLRWQGWFDDAIAMYAPISAQMPQDQSLALRIALAHAGAGRIDLAHRLLTELQQYEGSSESSDLSDIAADLALVVLLSEHKNVTKEQADALRHSAQLLTARPVGTVFLVRAPAAHPNVNVVLMAQGAAQQPEIAIEPQVRATGLNIYRIKTEFVDRPSQLRLTALPFVGIAAPLEITVNAIASTNPAQLAKVMTTKVNVLQDGKEVTLNWTGSAWENSK